MIKYIVRRLLVTIPILLGVILITFILMEIIPGSAVTVLMQNKLNNEALKRAEEALNINQPLLNRFIEYCISILKGDLGNSLIMKKSVVEIIKQAIPNTLILTLFSIIFAWFFGIATGIISAVFNGSILDRFLMTIALVGISMPTFSIGILLQYLIAYRLKWLPISGSQTIHHFVIPSIVLGWSMAGEIARLMRSKLLTTLKSPFVITAKAKGASLTSIVLGHSLKISMLPIISIMAMQFTMLLGGALITENIFGIPGIGTLSVSALTNRDTPLIQGIILLSTAVIIFGNLIADVLYALLDVRVFSQYEEV